MSRKTDPPPTPDPRPEGLVHIGWISIAMLGICIPLCAILAGISPGAAMGLPMLIVGGAIGGATLLWAKGGGTQSQPIETTEVEELKNTIRDLNARLESLEAIDSYERNPASQQAPALPQAAKPISTPPVLVDRESETV